VLQARYEELPIDDPILVVCRSGGRSNQAATFLDSMGFSVIYDMQGGMNAWIWDTELCIEADEKYSGGTGEPNDPYQIATAEDLIALGETPEDYDKYFILTADIDLDPNLPGRKIFDKAVIAPDVNDAIDSWGNYLFDGTLFTGVFDGNGHTISHLTITGDSYLGLFGQLGPAAIISNLALEAVDVNGVGYSVGGLVGLNYGYITNCSSTGTVSGEWRVGGLVGVHDSWWGFGGPLIRSRSNCSVTGNESVGGLLGHNGATVTECNSTGSVSGNQGVGGLAGSNGHDSETEPAPSGWLPGISECYSTGTVEGNEEVGGLVGSNGGEISTSYSSGTVTGKKYVGGLLGRDGAWKGFIVNCYSSGQVFGETRVGGLIGDRGTTHGVSFWDIETSGQTTSSGGTGLTTAEMQTVSTFLEAGWDLVGETENGTEDIWSICEGTNYPRFVWQIPACDFVCPDGITIDDLSFFMEHWLDDNCDSSNDYCEGTDLDQSGTVDVNDLEIFFENWSAEQK
jgi:hypothetical protein